MSRFRVTGVTLAANVVLFAVKFWGFLMSGSVALFSDAMNSLLDIASSGAVLISVRVGQKAPDREHPFGHSRAEPIAGFVVAVVGCVIGVEVLQESVIKFIRPHNHEINPWLFGILAVAIAAKLALSVWQQRVGERERSPAVAALSVDSRNDVLSSIAAMIGIGGASLGFQQADELAGLVVGLLIIRGAVIILRENIDYLLGRSSSDELREAVKRSVAAVPGVGEVRFCRGHYVGNELHFEIIIACQGDLSTAESAAIADRVRDAATAQTDVGMVFVHVDSLDGPQHYEDLLQRNVGK
jgi:cation diffusion facilitator family transporter